MAGLKVQRQQLKASQTNDPNVSWASTAVANSGPVAPGYVRNNKVCHNGQWPTVASHKATSSISASGCQAVRCACGD